LADVEVITGKEIVHLTKVQPVNSFKNIREDLQKILIASYVADLLDKLLQIDEPDKNIFLLLKNFLEFLDQSADIHPIILDAFIVKLFKLLGFDMSCDEKMNVELREEVNNLLASFWPTKKSIEYGKNYPKLHRAVYNFSVFHSEHKFAYFSEIW
jgi:DNA repair protein RecO